MTDVGAPARRRTALYCLVVGPGTPSLMRMPEHFIAWRILRRAVHDALRRHAGVPASRMVSIEGFAGAPEGDDDPQSLELAERAFSGSPTLTRLDLYAWEDGTSSFSLARRAVPAPAYPMADRDRDGWYSDGDYVASGGRMTSMTPAAYLARVRPLTIDEASRDAIDDLKRHMIEGRPLDPLKIYADGSEDGRHRANAALELGTETVPVILWNEPALPDMSIQACAGDPT